MANLFSVNGRAVMAARDAAQDLIPEWQEDDVLSLPLGNVALERQGARLLDLTLFGADEKRNRSELAKQLSAFANTGGGTIIYGLADDGTVDQGGVTRLIKGRQSAKEWLEIAIPAATESEIAGVTVSEVLPKVRNSTLSEGKAIYIVQVPDSERAPHQSAADRLYYVRRGAQSQPASHRTIEDIRNRVRHPNVSVTGLALVDVFLTRREGSRIFANRRQGNNPRHSAGNIPGNSMGCRLKINLKNIGTVKAGTACVQIETEPTAFFDKFDDSVVSARRAAARDTIFFEMEDAIYPGMEINFWFEVVLPVEALEPLGTLKGALGIPEGMKIACRVFADDAPAKSSSFALGKLPCDTGIFLSSGR